MIKHFSLLIFRIFFSRKGSYIINILGLTLGFFGSLTALYWASDEIGYNSNVPQNENVIRVLTFAEDWKATTAATAFNLAPTLKQNFPEVQDFCRTENLETTIQIEDNQEFTDDILFADSSFIRLFGWEFQKGSHKISFQHPNYVILTKSYAKKLFGNQDPIGKTIVIKRSKYSSNLIVTGVLNDNYGNSTVDFNILADISVIRKFNHDIDRDNQKNNGDGWIDSKYQTFVKLQSKEQIKSFTDKLISEGVKEYPGYFNISYRTQPIRDIYLSNMLVHEDPSPHGNLLYTLILLFMGFLILVVSCINYIILSTSQASHRIKEYGIRKTYGANNTHIITQAFIEYLLFSLLASFLALILIQLTYPALNTWFDRVSQFSLFSNIYFPIGLILVIIITTFLSTFYLNVYIISINPVNAINGINKTNVKYTKKYVLIGVQLTIFCAIFTTILTINRQINFLNTMDIGLDKKNLIIIPEPSNSGQKYQVFKTKLLTIPEISGITASGNPTLPSNELFYIPVKASGESGEQQEVFFDMINVGFDFIKTFEIKLLNGLDMSENNFPNRENICLITKSGATMLNLKEPVGSILSILDGEMYPQVVGVVEDFYVTSLFNKPNPIMLTITSYYNDFYIRIDGNANVASTLKKIKKTWEIVYPDVDFNYSFYDETYKTLYGKVTTANKVSMVFAFFALALSIIGLYGLSSQISNQRYREMCIRKVFGATIKDNFIVMVKSFLLLTILCNLIALPISFIISNSWLSQFYLHQKFNSMDWGFTFIVSFLVVLISIGGTIFKSANTSVVLGLKEK
jgi:putative ABC transport system permease protein